jgi:hypothetical protein
MTATSHALVCLVTLDPCRYDDLTVTSQIYDKRSNIKIPTVIQYLLNRNGPLATTGCDHGAFVSTKVGWLQYPAAYTLHVYVRNPDVL